MTLLEQFSQVSKELDMNEQMDRSEVVDMYELIKWVHINKGPTNLTNKVIYYYELEKEQFNNFVDLNMYKGESGHIFLSSLVKMFVLTNPNE